MKTNHTAIKHQCWWYDCCWYSLFVAINSGTPITHQYYTCWYMLLEILQLHLLLLYTTTYFVYSMLIKTTNCNLLPWPLIIKLHPPLLFLRQLSCLIQLPYKYSWAILDSDLQLLTRDRQVYFEFINLFLCLCNAFP